MSRIVIQVRRLAPACAARRRSSAVPALLGGLEDDLLEGALLRRELGHRTPDATSRALRASGSSARTQIRSPSRRSIRPSSSARAPSGSGVRTTTRPVGRCRSLELVLQHQPAAVEHADAGAHLLDLGEQVAGEEDRRAGRVELEQQLPDLADALRVQAVGGLVEHQQPGPAQQCGGQAEPLSHAEGVGAHRAPVDAVRGRPGRARRRCVRRGSRRAPPGPLASKSARLARPERWG